MSVVTERRRVYIDDLIDAVELAGIIHLANRTAVSVYQKRYPDMPRPILDLGAGRSKLWLRSEVLEWEKARTRK